MRLWHEILIPILPRQQLLGQHRECCALRGNGWGKPHSVVNYVFRHSPMRLYRYHRLVMDEMRRRGYRPDQRWDDPHYRGLICSPYRGGEVGAADEGLPTSGNVYPEHDDAYLTECLENLRGKAISIDVAKPNKVSE